MDAPAAVASRHAVLRLVLPPVLAVALFAAAVWWLIIPATGEALLDGKRETLRAIVASAHSLCERHHADEVAGRISRAQAQARTADDLRALRYGEENRDYLWVIDSSAHMVAHPYRPDLEGVDLMDYADPDGVRLFAESVAAVAAADEGYITYRWQWHDDAERIEPKKSYVRGFAPWGWVIGSGIYLNDVEAEKRRTTRWLAWITAAVSTLVAVLVAIGLRQGWLSEQARQAAEVALARSHARFEALAHASSEAVWLVVDGRVVGANRRANGLLGRMPATAAALFSDPQDHVLVAGGAAGPRQVLLAAASGQVPALVEVEPVLVEGQSALVVSARDLAAGAPAPDERDRRLAAEALNQDAALAQARLLEPVADWAQPVPCLPLTASPEDCAAALAGSGGATLLLEAPDGGIAGLVTAGDLLRRGGATAYAAMSSPVQGLTSQASLAEALDLMTRAGIDHLLVRDHQPPALLDAGRLLEALRASGGPLLAAVAGAPQAALPELNRRLQAWMAALSRVGVDPELAAAEGTRIADAILQRCIALTCAERGEPPVACCFLVVGSQGRRELLPGGDQDNALVFAEGGDPDWFAAFGAEIVARFLAAGWPRCHGGCHAGEARWCLSLNDWQARYDGWINEAEPQALLQSAVFFDARAVWGDSTLAADLAAHVQRRVAQRQVFLVQLAQEVLQARSPRGLFGGIRLDDEQRGTTNLKLAMLHIVSFGRVKALAHGLAETGTAARLRALAAGGHVDPEVIAEALACWRFLLGLRLQTRSAAGGSDHISPQTLDDWNHSLLKRALAGVDALRERLRQDLSRVGV